MGLQRETPKKASPGEKKSMTLQHLFDLDSPKNCGNKESSDSQNEEILSLISHIFALNDPLDSPSQQDLKRLKLVQILSILKTSKSAVDGLVLSALFAMLSANLFRPLPPGKISLSCIMPDDEEHATTLSASWSHLQIVYDILQLLLVKTEAKDLREYIDHPFLLNLLSLFRSEDPRERESLKNVYHQIYSKFTFYRSLMRKAMNDVLLHYIFETDHQHCGIGDILEIWGSIINGFTVPLKEEHKVFLMRVLIPLHKLKGIQAYHRQLTYCVTQFVEKEPVLGGVVVRGILKYWPVTNCQKEVLLIGELEDLVENMHPQQFRDIALPLCTRMTKCLNSWNSRVAERALYAWNNEQLVKMAARSQALEDVFRVVVEGVERNLKFHWSKSVKQLTEDVKEMLQGLEPNLYSKCLSKLQLEESAALHKELRRKEMWERVEMAANRNHCISVSY